MAAGRFQIVLASASARRRELMARFWGDDGFSTLPLNIAETLPDPGLTEDGDRQAQRLARQKLAAAESVWSQAKHPVHDADAVCLIAADTLVSLSGHLLGKPDSPEQACEQLRMLSGQRHQVFTGLAIALLTPPGVQRRTIGSVTDVQFAHLTDEMIRWYVASQEPLDKAGSYAIQGLGASLVFSIEGCYYTVVGLPVQRLFDLLGEARSCLPQPFDSFHLLPWDGVRPA